LRRQRTIPRRITSCLVCGARDQCIRASHLWGVRHSQERLRQVIDEIRYNRSLTPTEELEQGRKAHELLERNRRVEKDLQIIFERINGRSEPFYMTATFCSPTFGGLRCQPDAVYVEPREDSLKLLIIEDKTSNQPRYYTQLYAEGVILTDRQCLIAPAFARDHLGVGGKTDERRVPFYPVLMDFQNFAIEVSLNPYVSLERIRDKPLNPIRFSQNFHMLPETESKYFAVTQSKKVIMKALKHPQYVDVEKSAQMRFTQRGRELKTYLPKGAVVKDS
jgi:hypothetical protein